MLDPVLRKIADLSVATGKVPNMIISSSYDADCHREQGLKYAFAAYGAPLSLAGAGTDFVEIDGKDLTRILQNDEGFHDPLHKPCTLIVHSPYMVEDRLYRELELALLTAQEGSTLVLTGYIPDMDKFMDAVPQLKSRMALSVKVGPPLTTQKPKGQKPGM